MTEEEYNNVIKTLAVTGFILGLSLAANYSLTRALLNEKKKHKVNNLLNNLKEKVSTK